jgi:voltage-gated potassium channel
MQPVKILWTEGEGGARRTILWRAALAFGLFLLVLAVHWFNRDGIRNNISGISGDLTFIDVLYFTAITVTTVGYGDIVPFSQEARLFSALVVTPIRVFIWLLFLGTAYQFVAQKLWERFRMSRLAERLENHVVVCGYGYGGHVAAREVMSKGVPANQVVIIDPSLEMVQEAADQGHTGLHGDATREAILQQASLTDARALIVATSRDDTNLLIVLTARHLAPKLRIISRVEQAENVKLLKQAGADVVVSPSELGGFLLADSVFHEHTAETVADFVSAGGRVELRERVANLQEVGAHTRSLPNALVVQLYRKNACVDVWDNPIIQEGDRLVLIEKPLR